MGDGVCTDQCVSVIDAQDLRTRIGAPPAWVVKRRADRLSDGHGRMRISPYPQGFDPSATCGKNTPTLKVQQNSACQGNRPDRDPYVREIPFPRNGA